MFFFKLAVVEMSSNEGAKKIEKRRKQKSWELKWWAAKLLLRLGGSNKLIKIQTGILQRIEKVPLGHRWGTGVGSFAPNGEDPLQTTPLLI